MNYKINFWPVPNWSRESSINPNFTMVVVIALLALISLLWIRMAENQLKTVEQENNSVQEELDKIRPKAEELYQFREETEFWETKLDRLRLKGEKRIFWSRQLAALQQLIPPHIVLTNLSIRDESVTVEIPPSESLIETERVGEEEIVEHRIVHRLHIEAQVEGESAEQKIADFARSVGESEIIGERLENYSVRNISSPSRSDRENVRLTNFVLECIYKQMPEIL